jgi:hypothetical protein
MPDLPRKPGISGGWSWGTELLIDAVGQLGLIAGLTLLAGLIVREIVFKNSGALPGQQVV